MGNLGPVTDAVAKLNLIVQTGFGSCLNVSEDADIDTNSSQHTSEQLRQ